MIEAPNPKRARRELRSARISLLAERLPLGLKTSCDRMWNSQRTKSTAMARRAGRAVLVVADLPSFAISNPSQTPKLLGFVRADYSA